MKLRSTNILLLIVLMTVVSLTKVTAQESYDDVRVINEIDAVWNFGIQGINLYSRPVHRIDIAYPSTDPEGDHYPLIVRFSVASTDVATGVSTADAPTSADDEWFSLQGIRQTPNSKGISINRNGQKILGCFVEN